MAVFHIRLLGGWQLERHGQARDPPPPRLQALLAYLLLHRDAPQSRAHLSFLLWPDSKEAQARTNLRQSLHHLRRELPETTAFLRVDGRHLQWRPDSSCTVDVPQFERTLERAAAAEAADGIEEARVCFERAVEIYGGALLPHLYEPWLEPERERLHELFGAALESLARVLERQGEYRNAVLVAQRSIRHDRLNEAPYRQLMRLHASMGERSRALQVYQECTRVLQGELGVGPSELTSALHAQLARPTTTAPPSSGPLPRELPGFVGRTAAWARLWETFQAIDSGGPALVLVKGDSGIGKSRLVEEFARAMRTNDVTSAAARCYAADGAMALAPVTALLRTPAMQRSLATLEEVWLPDVARLLPELALERPELPQPAPLTQDWQRQRLYTALARTVVARQPLLLVLDDVQWCDRETLAWLHYLLRFDRTATLMVIGTARTHELDGNTESSELFAALERDDLLTEIELPPLDRPETAALARSLHPRDLRERDVDAVFRETEGNPLFIVEMMRTGAVTNSGGKPALSAKLRSVISQRLKRLPQRAGELAGMAAVIGREFGFELLVGTSGWSERDVIDGLDELWRHGLVRERHANHYDFSHDKLREVAYTELSRTRRLFLHRSTAEALEAHQETNGGRASAQQIAFHYDQAGVPERAIPCYLQAADALKRLYANDDALRQYRRALELTERLPDTVGLDAWRRRVTTQIHEGIGDVVKLTGDHDGSRAAFERALGTAPDTDRRCRARLWQKVAGTWVAQYRYRKAFGALEAAEAAIGPPPDPDEISWWRTWLDVRLTRARTHYWLQEWREMDALLREAEPAVQRCASAVQRGGFYKVWGQMVLVRDRFVASDEALAHARAALSAALETGDPRLVANEHFGLGFQRLWRHELSEAEAQFERALAATERTGDALLRARCLLYLCFVHRKRNDLDQTARVVESSLEAATSLEMPEYLAASRGHRAWLAWKNSEFATVEREVALALELWPKGQAYPMRWCALYPLLAARLQEGKIPPALECAGAMLHPKQQRLPEDVTRTLENALGAAAKGSPHDARAWLERSIPLAERALLL